MNRLNNDSPVVNALSELKLLQRQLQQTARAIRTGKADAYTAQMQTNLTRQLLSDINGKRNIKGDRISVADYVTAYYGTPQTPINQRQHIFSSKGHIVNYGLYHLISWIAANSASGYGWYAPSYAWTSKTTYLQLGTGGGETQSTTSTLTSAIATLADTQAGATGTASGSPYVAWTATWNAGSLSAVEITEMGLFLRCYTTLLSFGYSNSAWQPSSSVLFSRLSEDDGDFTGFTVNTAVPLTIQWNLQLTFA